MQCANISRHGHRDSIVQICGHGVNNLAEGASAEGLLLEQEATDEQWPEAIVIVRRQRAVAATCVVDCN